MTVEGRQCKKRISPLYRSRIQNSKQLVFHMGRKVRSRRKSLTCWNSLFHQNPKLNVAQRHATHPQSLNLQRKCMLVNILTYSKISLKLQQNQKRLENRALKCMRKMKVMEGVVTLRWSWLMSAKNKDARGSVYWELTTPWYFCTFMDRTIFGVTSEWG